VPYYWTYGDNAVQVTTGAATQPTWGGVIQRNDGLGGYNTQFAVPNSAAYYHVHFAQSSTQVTTVRYFGGGGGQGNNILTFSTTGTGGGPTTRMTLGSLVNWLGKQGVPWPNHVALFNNLAAVIPPGRTPSGEIQ
jgi:hypothetical protein